MRALFEDLRYKLGTSQADKFQILQVGQPVGTGTKDLYFYVSKSGAGNPILVNAYATRAEAHADDGTVVASWSIAVPLVAGAYASGAGAHFIHVTGSQGSTGSLDFAWCYTAAPDLVACDNIRDLLREYVDAGEALADLTSEQIMAGPIVAATEDRGINVWSPDWAPIVSNDTRTLRGLRFRYAIGIYRATLDEEDDAGVLEANTRRLREWQSRIETIVSDEQRNKYRVGSGFRWIESDAPTQVEADGAAYQVATVYVTESINMWADFEYPRT